MKRLVFPLLCLVGILLVAIRLTLEQRQIPARNYSDFEPTELAPSSGLGSWLPSDFLHPDRARIPPPHPAAAAADEALRGGDVAEALRLYRELSGQRRLDVYATFLTACLSLEQGEVYQARQALEKLQPDRSLLRSVRLLKEYLRQNVTLRRAPADAWLHAVLRVALSPAYAFLPPGDPLFDQVERRVLLPPPPWLELRDLPDEQRQALELWETRDLVLAGRVLDQGAGLALTLLALTVASGGDDAAPIVRTLDWISRLEPDNAHWDLLLAAEDSPLALLDSARAAAQVAPPGQQTVVLESLLGGDEPPLTTASIDALLQAANRPNLDTHVGAVFRLLASARRAAGDPFAELHVPSARELVFLGDPGFPERLLLRAHLALSNPAPDADPDEARALLHAAVALLANWRALPPSERRAASYPSERARALLDEAANQGLDVRPLQSRLARAAVPQAMPPAVRPLRRYLQHPLPIPSLVEQFLERYGADQNRLAADLRRLVQR